MKGLLPRDAGRLFEIEELKANVLPSSEDDPMTENFIPSVALKLEKVLSWAQLKEPNPQTPIYENAGGWSETEELLRKEARKLGIYLGKGWVAMINECGDVRGVIVVEPDKDFVPPDALVIDKSAFD